MKGGKVVASGGIGCVFDPALLCEGQNDRQEGYVTKLMTETDRNAEWEALSAVKPILEEINDSSNYFIAVETNLCNKPEFDQNDKEEYNEKCQTLARGDQHLPITIDTLQYYSSSNYIAGINYPYGGINILQYLQANGLTYELNQALIKTLENGIIPMNKSGLIHQDLKAVNMVYDTTNVRVIDWDHSGIIKSNNIPKNTTILATLQYQLPMSCILFEENGYVQSWYNSNGIKLIKEFLTDPKNQVTVKAVNDPKSVTAIIKKIVDKKLAPEFITNLSVLFTISPHFNLLAKLLNTLFSDRQPFNNVGLSENDRFLQFIASRMCHLLIDKRLLFYPNNTIKIMKFDRKYYFNTVYRHICDIYGFLTTYLNYITDTKITTPPSEELRGKILKLVSNHLYGPYVLKRPYDINKLIGDLNNLVQQPVDVGGKKTKKRKLKSKSKSKPKPKKNTRRNHKNKKSRRKNKKN